MITRRNVILGGAAIGLSGGALALTSRNSNPFENLESRPVLKMPELMDTTTTGRFSITAQLGHTELLPGKPTGTIGFNQSYLGPVIKMKNGALQANVSNQLSWPISAHWHGLLVPGEHDGGPHLEISQGQTWKPDMEISQDPCTAFFHTHVHGRTARDVYAGLAGVIHVSDGLDNDRGLPSEYGVDDLTLVLQDRRFDQDGNLQYAGSMMDVMHGMTGDTMLVNGQYNAVAAVPKGIVRLRLINASNARIYSLFCDDGRPLGLIATDGGYLPSPVFLKEIRLSPGERVEVLVDFQSGKPMALMSGGDPNQGMGGMMGRARGIFDDLTGARQFALIPFIVDETKPAAITQIPDDLGGNTPSLDSTSLANTRRFSLDMGMGGGMMGRGGMGGMMGGFSINGKPFDMNVVNERIDLGSVEKWIISTDMLSHPFHVHGVSFQVIKENGQAPLPESKGWKDTILVNGETELLVHFTQPAAEETPFMYHCHILEHEDAGMMGQFSVS